MKILQKNICKYSRERVRVRVRACMMTDDDDDHGWLSGCCCTILKIRKKIKISKSFIVNTFWFYKNINYFN